MWVSRSVVRASTRQASDCVIVSEWSREKCSAAAAALINKMKMNEFNRLQLGYSLL